MFCIVSVMYMSYLQPGTYVLYSRYVSYLQPGTSFVLHKASVVPFTPVY